MQTCKESPCLTQKQLRKTSVMQCLSAVEVFIIWRLLLVITITFVNLHAENVYDLILGYTR